MKRTPVAKVSLNALTMLMAMRDDDPAGDKRALHELVAYRKRRKVRNRIAARSRARNYR